MKNYGLVMGQTINHVDIEGVSKQPRKFTWGDVLENGPLPHFND